MRACVCACAYECVRVCVCVWVGVLSVYVFICTCVCVCDCKHVHVCKCVHVSVYIYARVHVKNAFRESTSGGVYVPCIFTRMPGKLSKATQVLLLCLNNCLQAPINSLVCGIFQRKAKKPNNNPKHFPSNPTPHSPTTVHASMFPWCL